MRYIFLVLCILCNSFGFAQNIKFMGIPLGTAYSSFKKQLIIKGYKYDAVKSNNSQYPNYYLFTGKFAGETVGLSVMVTPKSKIVYAVNARFIAYTFNSYSSKVSLEDLYAKFDDIRSILIRKYPNISINDWSTSNVPKASGWETLKMSIDLTIAAFDKSQQTLDLRYTDKVAEAKDEYEKESDF